MALTEYFEKLIQKVETSSEITNQGKDKDGFFQPTKQVVLKELNLLKDLHAKPLAKPMVKTAWKFVVENLPPEFLAMTPEQKAEMKKILD